MGKEIAWHSISWKEAVKELDSDSNHGLKKREVKKRQAEFGKNLLPKEKPLSKIRIFCEQFKSPLIYILLIAGIVVLFFREYTDAIVIFGAVFLNIIVGFFQENKASNALMGLKKIVKIKAQVIREENSKMIDSSDIVPGDIIILSSGEKVPADARIIQSNDLKINEMAMTGEWLPAEKKENKLSEKTTLADRDNMVYMGTIIEHGKARAVVVATGLKSEIGHIAEMIKDAKEEKTPLQKKLYRFYKIVGVIILAISIIITNYKVLKRKFRV